MRIFRCKTNWILAGFFLLLMIITNGCTYDHEDRQRSPTMETKPETWRTHAHRPVKNIPPVTTTPPARPPKPPKPPCKGHHH